MLKPKKQKKLASLLAHWLALSLTVPALPLAVTPARAMDTDIFTAENTPGAAPNVLIVLDNTSNWARQNQHWPGGIQQGQSEVDAIKTVIQNLPGSINVGLLEFTTGGPATDDGGYVRFPIAPVGQGQGDTATANRTAFTNTLNTIYANITSPNEKQNSNMAYGDLMYDAYNYFAGATPFASSADVVASLPTTATLSGGGTTNGYVTNFTRFRSPLSASTSCANNYIIFIGNPNASGPASDAAANDTALRNLGGSTTELPLPNFTTTSQNITDNLGYSAACYATPPSTLSDFTSLCPPSTGAIYNSCAYSSTDKISTTAACAGGTLHYSVTASQPSTVSDTFSTTVGQSTGSWSACSSSTLAGAVACPSPTVTTSGNLQTTKYWGNTSGGGTSSCYYGTGQASGGGSTCNGNKKTYPILVDNSETVVVNTSVTTTSTLGLTSACYSSLGTCSTADYSCPAGATCACSATGATSSGASCSTGSYRYQVQGTYSATVDVPTGTTSVDNNNLNADEWAAFMYLTGVPVQSADSQSYQKVSTYTIDVYNAQPNVTQSALLSSMARAGGGKYFSATNGQQIVLDLQAIFAEIQAVNTTFASASLPISATNRAQNDNQVYIGMFRPDPTDHPRWFGNLKRYQMAIFNGFTDLADFNGSQAVSPTTGFVTPCAVSWWTTDSGSYWFDTANNLNRIFITQAFTAGTSWLPAGADTNFAKGTCGTLGTYSDLPDGPTVEKGGAAEMQRQQASRTVKTLSASNALVDFNTTNVTASADATINANIVNFILGRDVTGEIAGVPSTSRRPSIHGDVVHSRPLPVDYGGNTGVVVYYGANDGTYRAVDASSGQEKWAFVAPETFSGLQRLLDNTPLIQTPYPTPPGGIPIAGATIKQFFFDGSTGLYQNADNSKVWIFPAMRRGGRMIHAFDVSTPASPQFKWKVGCPNLGEDTGCTAGMSGIGQTWSTPNVAFLSGYSSTTPVVIVGGGYDACEDADSASPSCATPKGAAVYVLDASTGAVIKSFATDRSIASDVTLVDINLDGQVDAAYVADTGGSLYRIDFSSPVNNFAPVDFTQWQITKVAFTSGAARKFLFAPAVLPYRGSVYLAIGSGDREHPLAASYPYTTPVTNRFYVYLDNPLRTGATNLDGSSMFNYSNAAADTCQTESVLPGGTKLGWYMDLTANGVGEQVVTSALIIGGLATFNTNRPVVSATACTSALGEARGYWVNLLNGSGAIGVGGVCGGNRSNTFVSGGLPPSPVAGTVTIRGTPQNVVIGAVQRSVNAASSPISGQQLRPPISSKRTRIYWRDTGNDTR